MHNIVRASLAAALLAIFMAPSDAAVVEYSKCADEGGVCQIPSGTRRIRFGVPNSNRAVSRELSGSVSCTTAVFGDPARGQVKECSYAGASTGGGGVDPGFGQAPTRAAIAGKTRINGRITATSGQTIENINVTTATGPCIVIPPNVTNVTIRNNEIGPCGSSQPSTIRAEGVFIDVGAGNVTMQANVFHDMSSAVYAYGARHPIVFDRNLVQNIRGPFWQGQIVQFDGVRGGSGQSKITCNVRDGWTEPAMAVGTPFNEDHINISGSEGVSASQPIEIAYNRIRGRRNGGGRSGTGMQLGDDHKGSSGYIYAHHNTVVQSNGVGISIAGGHDIRIENNKVDQRGVDQASQTGWPFAISSFYHVRACFGHVFANNRATIARLWAFNNDGSAGPGIFSAGNTDPFKCTWTESGNNFNDSALTAVPYTTGSEATFAEIYTECNSGGAAPTYAETQVFPLGNTPATTPQGQNVNLTLRYYGRNLPENTKPNLWLLNSSNGYVGELINHFWLLPSATWNGSYWQFAFISNVGASIPVGTYKIVTNLYGGHPLYNPAIPYFDSVECNGTTRISGFLGNNAGCYIGNLTVSGASGPPDTTYSGTSGVVVNPINGTSSATPF